MSFLNRIANADLVTNAWQAIRRFPLTYLAALAGTFFAIYYIHDIDSFWMNNYAPNANPPEFLLGYVWTAMFAVPLTLGLDVFAESRKFKIQAKTFLRFFGIAAVVIAFFFFFKDYDNWLTSDFVSFFLLELAALFFLLFAPYLSKGKANAFWQYTMTLVVRFLQAFAFFAILFLGIVLLLSSIDYLFDVNIDDNYYLDTWVVIVGVLSIPFFLAGVPKDFNVLDRVKTYPKGLRILTEYILVPLVILYLMVLYAYTGKIVFTWDWPNGDTAIWIIVFLCVGILTYFFAYSLKEKFLSYVEFFKKWFFVAAIPLVVVLFMAVWIRISEYGWTEPRYFIVAGGVWLSLMAIYFIFSKRKDLRVLVFSLFVILVVSNYGGPVSAFGVSERSQTNRLEELLVKNDILKDGKVVMAESDRVSTEDSANIVSIVQYLLSTHGVEGLQQWFDEDLSKTVDDSDYYYDYSSNYSNQILTLMGVDPNAYYSYYAYTGSDNMVYVMYQRDDDCAASKGFLNCAESVQGFDYLYGFDSYSYAYTNYEMGGGSGSFLVNGDSYALGFKDLTLVLSKDGSEIDVFDFSGLINKAKNIAIEEQGLNYIPENEMTILFDNKFMKGELRINYINVIYDSYSNNTVNNLDNVNGRLLFNLK